MLCLEFRLCGGREEGDGVNLIACDLTSKRKIP